MRYLLVYYINSFGLVQVCKMAEDKGVVVGGKQSNIIQTFEITEDEYNEMSLRDLKGKYELP